MPYGYIKMSYNIEINVLAKQISDLVKTVLNPQDFKREVKDGGVLFSYIKDDYVIAAYNHPAKYHGAFVRGVFLSFTETAKCVGEPGEWAIAWLKYKQGNKYTCLGFT